MTEQNYEEIARKQGWRPEAEFKGAKESWVDAQTFVERAADWVPSLKKSVDEQKERANALEADLAVVKQTAAEFEAMKESVHKNQIAQYKREIADLKAQKVQAINDNNGEQVVKLDDDIAQAEAGKAAAETPAASPATPAADSPALIAFKKENPWYGADEALTAAAEGYAISLKGKVTGPEDALKQVSEFIRTSFPEKFQNPNRDRDPIGDAGAGGSDSEKTTGLTYNQLTAEEKEACDRFVEMIPDYTREKYCADLEIQNAS